MNYVFFENFGVSNFSNKAKSVWEYVSFENVFNYLAIYLLRRY